jgi:TetR/AcrR family transcriptional repressor of nem operon
MLTARKSPRRKVTTPRNPQRTRERLLQAAFQEIYRSGFRGTDLETILDTAGVTKGALYHHFDSKEALGYALVDEVILGLIRDKWFRPLQNSENPIDALVSVVQSTSLKPEHVRCGCPLNNLAQEMSPLDEGFRKRLAKIFSEWHDGIAAALREGQKRGVVRSDVDPDETATFLIAANEGCWSLAKNSQDVRVLQSGMRSMIRYLESLRAPRGRSRAARSG